MSSSEINDLKTNYHTIGHPIAFAGIHKIYNYYNRRISIDKIKDILSSIDTYTLHREYHEGKRNHSYSHFPRYQFQMDIVDVQELSKHNDGYKYLLTCIDTFTRYAWAQPLRDKSGRTVISAFEEILKSAGKSPIHLVVDRGTEFYNKHFEKFCKDRNIKYYSPDSSIHGAFIERFNRTLQNIIYRYMTDNNTHRYIYKIDNGKKVNLMPMFLQTYNTRIHRMIGTSPENAENNPQSHVDIRKQLAKYYLTNPRKPIKYSIGDVVRIAKQRGKFSRGYHKQFQEELFKIKNIIHNKKIPMYEIETYDGTETIKGNFYDFELTKISI